MNYQKNIEKRKNHNNLYRKDCGVIYLNMKSSEALDRKVRSYRMKVRNAVMEELPQIMEIYNTARVFMRAHGNKTQWRQGYPSQELVQQDCRKGYLYVCEEAGEIVGVFMFYKEQEPTYQVIEQGNWLNDRPYGTMHRMAASGKVRGVAAFCLAWCFEQCRNLRGDTHADNVVMQRVFEKNGFKKCGIIHVENGTPRIAYQKEEC